MVAMSPIRDDLLLHRSHKIIFLGYWYKNILMLTKTVAELSLLALTGRLLSLL
jgi:hypothetical protein